MTTQREVPFTGDTGAWVHSEIGDMKSRLSLVQQAVDQSRSLATEAADAAHQARTKVDLIEGQAAALAHLQEDLRSVREHLVRAQDDINSLRQSRDDLERRAATDLERERQLRNDAHKRFGEIDREIDGWNDRIGGIEEQNRRLLEAMAQTTLRFESIESEWGDSSTMQSRTHATLSRLDQEMKLLAGGVAAMQREDDVLRERANTALEMMRRIETDVDSLKQDSVRLARVDDRLELVQAERTRHNERLNEITAELALVDHALSDQGERVALIDARSHASNEEVRRMREHLLQYNEQLGTYLQGLRELEADMRKRQIAALEKEMRDIRGRAFHVAEE